MTRSELLQTAKPILLNTEMVRAIQDNRKTVTRRLIKANLVGDGEYEYEEANGCYRHKLADCAAYNQCYDVKIIPPYKAGNYLYVRETWCKYSKLEDDMVTIIDGTERYYYRADGENPTDSNTFLVQKDGYDEYSDFPKWHPSIHMPKEAARIFLRVTDVRVERLQDITNEQAIREGCNGVFCGSGANMGDGWKVTPVDEYIPLWNSTVKKSDLDKYGWDANPWVWVIEFERVEVE